MNLLVHGSPLIFMFAAGPRKTRFRFLRETTKGSAFGIRPAIGRELVHDIKQGGRKFSFSFPKSDSKKPPFDRAASFMRAVPGRIRQRDREGSSPPDTGIALRPGFPLDGW